MKTKKPCKGKKKKSKKNQWYLENDIERSINQLG